MEQEAIKFLMNLGSVGVALVIGAKYGSMALQKLYNDINVQHKEQLEQAFKRETKLMEWLEKKNETDYKIMETLNNICDEMEKIKQNIKI